MSKAFLSSIIIHLLVIYAVIASVSKIESKVTTSKHIKKISLKHIVLKKTKPIQKPKEQEVQESKAKEIEIPKIQEELKQEPQSAQKPKPKSKPKLEPKVKPKSKVKKKRKDIKRKKVKKVRVKATPKKHIAKRVKKAYKSKGRGKKRRVVKSIATQSTTNVSSQVYIAKREYFSLNRSSIYQAIQRAKRYPHMAKRLNIQGVVGVSFTLHPDGSITNISTYNAHSLLQKAAKETIIRASSRFPRPSSSVNISLNIAYKLR